MIKKNVKVFRYIMFFAIFVLIVVIIGVPLSYATRPALAHTRKNITGFYAEPDNSLDVVTIGTSGTFTAYCPMEAWNNYGYASYNFCINVLATNVIQYCVVEVMKTQAPKILVIDCYPFISGQRTSNISTNEQDDGGLRYNTDAFRYSANRSKLIHDTLPLGYHKYRYYFDIFKYFGSTSMDFHYMDWKHNDISKGFNALDWGKVVLNQTGISQEIPLSKELDADLTELLDVCKCYDCKVLFVYYPYAFVTPVREVGYSGDDAIKVVNYMKRRVQEYGFDFLNMVDHYNTIDINPDRDYMEYAHFNILGAEKITSFFGKYLQEHYNLIDKRGNPEYKQWEKDYQAWEILRMQYETNIENEIIAGN